MSGALVDFYVHGRGRGHGTRSRVLADTLVASGYRVRIFAGSGARPAFEGLPFIAVDSLLPTMRMEALSLMRRRLRGAAESLDEERPTCVVSDGDLPGILHAKRHSIPSIAVGHGLVFSHAAAPAGVSLKTWKKEGLKSKISSAGSDFQLAVNFVPLDPINASTSVVRPKFVSPISRQALSDNKEVVCYFRDDNGEDVLRHLVSQGYKPILFSRETQSIMGVEIREPGTAVFRKALASAHAVVSSAGSQLISECLVAGIPHFTFYSVGDSEQQLNVEMLRSAGVGDGAAFGEPELERLTRYLADENQRDPLAPWGEDVASALLRLIRSIEG